MSHDYDISSLEQEYIQLRSNLYKKFLKYLLTIFGFIVLLELFRSFFFDKFTTILQCGVFIFGGILTKKFFSYFKEKQELILTISLMGLYLISTLLQKKGSYFDFPEDSFHYGSMCSLCEGLILSRMAKFSHRLSYSVFVTFVKVLIIPPTTFSLIFSQIFLLSFMIFLDIDKESHDKNLFSSYFNYKRLLLNFKNLVAQDIPEGIIIVTKDLKQCLFANDFFKTLVEDKPYLSIRSQLNQFIFQEEGEQSSKNGGSTPSQSSIGARTLLGYLEAESIQENTFSPSLKATYNLTYRKEIQLQQANQKMHKDYIFELKIVPLVWENQQALAVILIDITERHTILNLKIANSEKDKIVATVSHELRTPLNSILGVVQIMMKRVEDEEILHYLDICFNSGNLLMGLVNSILDLQQIKANKLKLNPERIELKQILRDLQNLFEYQYNTKSLYLKFNICSDAPDYLVTDKNRLSQIFINLLGNALKFTLKGGVQITIKKAEEEDFTEFCVEDTGVGIKEQDKTNLFQMFGKLDQENKHLNLQGVGLGLIISENLARLLQKNSKDEAIRLESEHGKGSKFTFWVKTNLDGNSAEAKELKRLNTSEIFSSLADNGCGEVNFMMQRHPSLSPQKKTQLFEKLHWSPSRFNSKNLNETFVTHRSNHETLRSRGPSFFFFNQDTLDSSPYILIVDDNLLNIMVAEHLILSHKFRVKTSLSGQAALDLISNNDHEKEPIKLILMDCQMPVMDGYQTTKALKKLFKENKAPEIPIVALTANDTEEDKETCKKAGMCEHLSKPLKDKELVKILNRYCV